MVCGRTVTSDTRDLWFKSSILYLFEHLDRPNTNSQPISKYFNASTVSTFTIVYTQQLNTCPYIVVNLHLLQLHGSTYCTYTLLGELLTYLVAQKG